MNQPTSVPTRKVGSALLAGALSTLMVFIFAKSGVEISGEAGGAITTILTFITGYFVPEGDPAPVETPVQRDMY